LHSPFEILFLATPAMGSTFRRDWSRNGYFELTLCSAPTNKNDAVRAKKAPDPLGECRLGERRLVDLMQLLSQRAGRSQTVGLQFESDLPLNSALTRVRLQWMSTLAGSTRSPAGSRGNRRRANEH
jgi:hypothetical protein